MLFVTFGVMNIMIAMVTDNVLAMMKKLEDEIAKADRSHKFEILMKIREVVCTLDVEGFGHIRSQQLEHAMANNVDLCKLLDNIGLPV